MEKDDRLLLLPDPSSPFEIREQYRKLTRWVEAEKWCARHDDSGYHDMMASRGIKQLQEFVRKHREILCEDLEALSLMFDDCEA